MWRKVAALSSGNKLIAEKRAGHEGTELLRTFERSQEIFESDLHRLLQQQGRG
jgi:predicted DNA-binding WGR domain protein